MLVKSVHVSAAMTAAANLARDRFTVFRVVASIGPVKTALGCRDPRQVKDPYCPRAFGRSSAVFLGIWVLIAAEQRREFSTADWWSMLVRRLLTGTA